MTEMLDKGIDKIRYNYLNLPHTISYSKIGNESVIVNTKYSATGKKLQKENLTTLIGINGSTTTKKITDYLDGFQYLLTITPPPPGGGGSESMMANSETGRALERQVYSPEEPVAYFGPTGIKTADLQFSPTAEGFYDYAKNQYIYQYKDHLGNVRVSFGRNSAGAFEITDSNDYYPFGMNHLKSGNSFFGAGSYKNYKYQGQELQETGFYSFKWRNYMPDVGRFFNIDPLAESFPYNSTYAFAENRVIDGRELEGLEWVTVKNDQGKTIERKLTVSITNDARLNERQYNSLIESIKTDFSSIFGADGARAQLTISDNSTMKVSLGNQVSETLTNAEGNEYSTYQGGVTAIKGESQINSFSVTAKADGTGRETSDITRSFDHEAAYSAGLDHP